MKEIAADELLKIQVDILQKVDKFCRNNKIPYTVFGGTCIGAIRHKGYIPWDDDIDIAMTRPNYNRFLQLFNGRVENLEVFAPELNWNYYAPYANVCDTRTLLDEEFNGHNGMDIGVKIDVFPIDAVSSNIDLYHAQKQNFIKLWNILYLKRLVIRKIWRKNLRETIAILLKRCKYLNSSYAEIQKEISVLIVKDNYEDAEYVDLSCYPWPNDSRCPREVFEDYINVPFENIIVSIIKRYDDYLTRAYGNYMAFPPKEKRVSHHHFKAYWKD